MGALHKGHRSLIEASVKENTHTIVSIFVNPTQFAPNEDLATYPRTLDSDIALCESLGVSAVFAPSADEMYKTRESKNAESSKLDSEAAKQNADSSKIDSALAESTAPSHASQIYANDEVRILPPQSMGYVLEGYARPTHFAGVLQVVMKLFMLTRAHRAYFGRKDAQQLLIIKRMVADLFIPITIRDCPIVRDDDGLALSSRNVYLSQSERQNALAIPRALESIKKAYESGESSAQKLREIGLKELAKSTLEVEYLQICDSNMTLLDSIIPQNSLVLLVARAGKTRLLDNLWL
ncbi:MULTISPECIES: pantoate--beta-alanine ligase [unclassified Helicobacter]|uniref:pantoate--beta-alanine ligase n=2 Tax=Helicobacter TaxID=209 RepID=UPI001F42E4A4